MINIPLQVYTAQYNTRDPDRFDTTVKTSNGTFAPTWEMVMKHKKGKISDEEYTQLYYDLMRKSFKKHRSEWDQLLSRDRVVLVCFCRKGKFCHRLLLAEILVKLGAEYKGEL